MCLDNQLFDKHNADLMRLISDPDASQCAASVNVAIGSMARTRFYVWNERAKHVLPSETDSRWFKYLDVEVR